MGAVRKRRIVEYESEVLEFSCTDDELEFFTRRSTLDVLWWRKQQDDADFRAEWGRAFLSCRSKEELELFRRDMYAAWRAGTRRFQ